MHTAASLISVNAPVEINHVSVLEASSHRYVAAVKSRQEKSAIMQADAQLNVKRFLLQNLFLVCFTHISKINCCLFVVVDFV